MLVKLTGLKTTQNQHRLQTNRSFIKLHIHLLDFCRCRGLLILETFTTVLHEEIPLPPFLDVIKEITHDKDYSLYNLSRKDTVDLNGIKPPMNGSGDQSKAFKKIENGLPKTNGQESGHAANGDIHRHYSVVENGESKVPLNQHRSLSISGQGI